MDQQPENLGQVLAAARASGVKRQLFKPQPTWAELGLDGHLKRLGWSILVYLLALAVFWKFALSGDVPAAPWSASIGALFISYAFMSLNAYRVQARLNESELSESGAWQVWVGALLLNPAVIGGYVSVSVYFRARRIRRQLISAPCSKRG